MERRRGAGRWARACGFAHLLVDPAGDGGDLSVMQRGGDLGGALEVIDRSLKCRVGALDAADDGNGASRLFDGALEWTRAFWLL